MRPKVLLMDEPFAALDVQTRAKMQDFLLDVWEESGASVLCRTTSRRRSRWPTVRWYHVRQGRVKTIVPVERAPRTCSAARPRRCGGN